MVLYENTIPLSVPNIQVISPKTRTKMLPHSAKLSDVTPWKSYYFLLINKCLHGCRIGTSSDINQHLRRLHGQLQKMTSSNASKASTSSGKSVQPPKGIIVNVGMRRCFNIFKIRNLTPSLRTSISYHVS